MQPVLDIITAMRDLEGTFPKREQKIADYVLANLETISWLNQNEIAKAADVSDATVNRFCITLGCSGFRDFKIRMAQSIAVSLQYMSDSDSSENWHDDAGHLVSYVFGALTKQLNQAGQQLQSEKIDEAVDILSQAVRILFVGVGGGSSNVAREGANRFFRLGIAASAHSDGYFQRMVASTLKSGDVLFAISASGQPAELLDSVTIARQYGAKTVALTKTHSDLSSACDVSIDLDLPEDQDIYKPSASRLVFMAIIDVLAAGVAHKRPDDVRETLRRIRMSLIGLSKDTGPKPIGD